MRVRLLPVLLLAGGPALAQYGQSPPPAAAPSTIPGQGASAAQVPQVAPAQQPAPQREPATSPWGSSPYGGMGGGAYGNGGYGGGSPYPPAASGNPYGSPRSAGTSAPGSPAPAGPGSYPSSPPATTSSRVTAGSGASPTSPDDSAQSSATGRGAQAVQRQSAASPRPPPTAQTGAADSARANADLLESFRQLADDQSSPVSSAIRGNSAAVRAQGGGSVQDSMRDQRIAAPALACAQNGNLPKVSRVRAAGAGGLAPGSAFIVQGLCYGSVPGTLRVMLPTALGRIRAVDAAVLSWEGGKLFAELPADLQNVVPGEATVEIWTADGRRSAAQPVAFEPHWALVPLPTAVAGRVQACTEAGEGVWSRCRVNEDSEADPRFAMPLDCRGGLGTCFGRSRNDPTADDGAALIFGQHYTQDVMRYRREPPKRGGRDQFELTLPPWLRPSHCAVSVTAFETEPGTQDAKASARFEGNTVLVDWSFERNGEPGWLQYQAHCQVWAPVGLVMR